MNKFKVDIFVIDNNDILSSTKIYKSSYSKKKYLKAFKYLNDVSGPFNDVPELFYIDFEHEIKSRMPFIYNFDFAFYDGSENEIIDIKLNDGIIDMETHESYIDIYLKENYIDLIENQFEITRKYNIIHKGKFIRDLFFKIMEKDVFNKEKFENEISECKAKVDNNEDEDGDYGYAYHGYKDAYETFKELGVF